MRSDAAAAASTISLRHSRDLVQQPRRRRTPWRFSLATTIHALILNTPPRTIYTHAHSVRRPGYFILARTPHSDDWCGSRHCWLLLVLGLVSVCIVPSLSALFLFGEDGGRGGRREGGLRSRISRSRAMSCAPLLHRRRSLALSGPRFFRSL